MYRSNVFVVASTRIRNYGFSICKFGEIYINVSIFIEGEVFRRRVMEEGRYVMMMIIVHDDGKKLNIS